MAWVIRTAVKEPWWHACHPVLPLLLLWRRRSLVRQLIGRELRARYRGSILGSCWSWLLPLVAVAVYALVFGVIFQQRWPGTNGSGWNFALVLFAGLALFNAFAEVVQRAPSVILAQPNLVKKIVFPLDILPVILVGTALWPLIISLAVVTGLLALGGQSPAELIQGIWVVVPLVLWLQGLAWILAGVGPFFRDIGPIVGALCPLLLFLTPIFYPSTLIPEAYRWLVWLNPLAVAVETLRAGLTGAAFPPAAAMLWLFLAALFTWQFGFLVFQRLRPEMADVI